MKDHRSTAQADCIDALTPVLGTLLTGIAFAVAFIVSQPGMMS